VTKSAKLQNEEATVRSWDNIAVHATVEHQLESLDSVALYGSAEVILILGEMMPNRPIADHTPDELLKLLLDCAEKLCQNEPETLVVVQSYLGAITRAKLKKLLGNRARVQSSSRD